MFACLPWTQITVSTDGHKSPFTRMEHGANAWNVKAPFGVALYKSFARPNFYRKVSNVFTLVLKLQGRAAPNCRLFSQLFTRYNCLLRLNEVEWT